jgi:hypothetical protein
MASCEAIVINGQTIPAGTDMFEMVNIMPQAQIDAMITDQ